MANELLTLARSVLDKNTTEKRDRAWDNRGTGTESLSHRSHGPGTAKSTPDQRDKAAVPLSHALGTGQRDSGALSGTALGTTAGQSPYSTTASSLKAKCPAAIESPRWQQAIRDSDAFLAKWGHQAHALGWTPRDLFGLHAVPERPAHTYSRLSRYDATGLIWLLCGRPVVALTESEAAIECSTSILVYRKHRKPALGPLGDSLDDLGAGS